MKRILLLFIAVLILIPQLSFADKLFFKKYKTKKHKPKIHPLQKYFDKVPKRISKSNKLLCLLIDFQEDDNPKTTGTGKFLTEADAADYPVTLGKPPHDYHFFMKQLTALRYYYQAASLGAFNLDYDLFPKPESGKTAYTLPHTMDYYNPQNASQELMLERFEEYFHDIFAVADKDESIHFADYGHFMVIHAGSDWQHDILGDTPCDIPSFFITVSDDKKAWVDNHTFSIDHTCNVPEMITQDIQTYQDDNYTEVYGYGVINAVMSHEFGHSLGFIDLYSTQTYRPAVGYFDIMDSGGSGLLGIAVEDTVYYVEGGLPVLPSVWHRILAWGDNFRERGILKDFNELPLNQDIQINPAEKPASPLGVTNPYFVKIPISDKEYLLLENRQVDPDGDGGTAVKTTSDKRVILHPIHYNDDPSDTLATYEYDFLLPGWVTQDARYIGGGLLVWHIDNKIIYDEGNYENNTVNRDFYHRGIKIVEADNILDIGNIHSRYWLGTKYEAYFRYKPILQNGYFVSWDNQTSQTGEELGIFNKELSSSSKPMLTTNNDESSNIKIYDISSYPVGNMQERLMTFKLGINMFDKSAKLNFGDRKIKVIGPANKMDYIVGEDYEIPFATDDTFMISSFINDQLITFDVAEMQKIKYLSLINYFDNTEKYLITQPKKITLFGNFPIVEFTYDDTITDYPLYIKETNELVVPTNQKLNIGETTLDIPNAKCYYNGSDIIALSSGEIYFINASTQIVEISYSIPNYNKNYEPVTFVDTLNSQNTISFIIDGRNRVLKLTKSGTKEIFSIANYTKKASSQLAIAENKKGMPYLVFGAGNRVFAINFEGSLIKHFPADIQSYEANPYSYPKIISYNQDVYFYLATDENYLLAIGEDGYIHNDKSMLLNDYESKVGFVTDKYIYVQQEDDSNFIISQKESSTNPIYWSGYRNNNYSVFYSTLFSSSATQNELYGYAFPNPAKDDYIKIRVFNSQGEIELKLFDISGSIIFKNIYEKTENEYRDLDLSLKDYSSGVYFALVKSGKKTIKIPFAIEK